MRRNERGFSLMEVTVVLALVSAIMIVVYGMIEQTVRTTMFNESHNDLAVLTQSAVNSIQTEVLQAKQFFEANTVGDAYRSALRLPSGETVYSDSLLPVIDPSTVVVPDTASARYTGNSLFLVRQLEPLSVTYRNASGQDVVFYADCYRFEYVYLTPFAQRQFASSGPMLDLVMAKSTRDYVDYFQLNSLNAVDPTLLARIMPRLRASGDARQWSNKCRAGLTQAWDPGQPIASAFYTLADADDGTFSAPVTDPSIPMSAPKSLLPGLRGGRISGKMDYSVAFGSFPIRIPVSIYSRPITAMPGFPSGFEVKIAGPAGNRQVMTRIVLMSHYGVTSYEGQQGFATTAVR